jgi:hypothetical protein
VKREILVLCLGSAVAAACTVESEPPPRKTATGGAAGQAGAAAGGSAGSATAGGAGLGGAAGALASGGASGTAGGAGQAGSLSTGGASGGGGGDTGGAGGAAGSAGAGGSSGAGGATGPSCESNNYIICEDFENTNPGTNVAPAGWTRNGSVDVISEPANVYRGTRAMRFNGAANGARRIVKSGADVQALGNGHWGRIFYKIQTPAPVSCSNCCGGVLHATFVALQGNGPSGGPGEYRVVDTVENQQGMHQFLYNIQYSGPETGRGSAYDWQYDGQWHCAEWHIDNPSQSFAFYLDGTQVTLSGNAAFDVPSSFSELRIGINNYQEACSPYLVGWIDEIALDHTRIGCD